MATRRNGIEVREMKRGRRIRETYLGMTLTNKRSAARAALRSETTEDGESEWTSEDESWETYLRLRRRREWACELGLGRVLYSLTCHVRIHCVE
jgi:hypothetical protein